MEFNKGLLLIVSLSTLLLSVTAGKHEFAPAAAPSAPALNILSSVSQMISFLQAEPGVKDVNPALRSLCKEAENPDLCASSIAPFLSNGPVDPVKALEIEIAACVNQTKKIAAAITQMLNDPGTPKKTIEVLDVCRANFDDVYDDLKDAVSAFREKDVGRAQTMLSAVITMQITCRDAFDETPGAECPFLADSNILYELAANCLAIFQVVMPSFFF